VIPATCRNCDAPLTGPYCARCGQHAHESARSLGALFHDAWHVITHVDGRFWSTLWLLLVRPGQLTLEYFAERRARYVPPVRLYLVISIVFFGLASLTSRSGPELTVGGAAGQKQAVAGLEEIKRDARQAALEARQAAREAAATAVVPDPAAAEDSAKTIANGIATDIAKGIANDTKQDAPAAAPAASEDEAGGFNFDIRDCDKLHTSIRWLAGPLQQACRRGVADHWQSMWHAFVANIPKTMFVFLPLIAFVMLLLYWFPQRYYVEHLVLLLHNHAALFLAMVLLSLLGLVSRLVPALDRAVTFGGIAVFGYAVWYVYRATRRYYLQGRALTLTKLAFVGLAYLICLVLTLIGNLVVSALIA
jgi:hypothetical protein